MDTSETYIKMWLTSGLEIEPDEYQLWVCPECLVVKGASGLQWKYGEDGRHWCGGAKYTLVKPFPRQDQLQGMLSNYFNEAYYIGFSKEDPNVIFPMLIRFNDFAQDNQELDSYEQLWLAFVMYELHGKKWSGERWE